MDSIITPLWAWIGRMPVGSPITAERIDAPQLLVQRHCVRVAGQNQAAGAAAAGGDQVELAVARRCRCRRCTLDDFAAEAEVFVALGEIADDIGIAGVERRAGRAD